MTGEFDGLQGPLPVVLALPAEPHAVAPKPATANAMLAMSALGVRRRIRTLPSIDGTRDGARPWFVWIGLRRVRSTEGRLVGLRWSGQQGVVLRVFGVS